MSVLLKTRNFNLQLWFWLHKAPSTNMTVVGYLHLCRVLQDMSLEFEGLQTEFMDLVC
jgi:hypothetical protein